MNNRKTLSAAVIAAAVCVGPIMSCDVKPDASRQTPHNRSVGRAPEAAPAKVRVIVYDDTDRNPLPKRSELWFRGHGSWWIEQQTQHGGGTETFGPVQTGTEHSFSLYPDERQGREIVVRFKMTTGMNSAGSVRDAISISITDAEVVVSGLPIKAASGQFEERFNR
jgi:hypothetical protein